ncbi:MAG: TetR family transcriptional regulator [Mycobacteriales bacterium]
MARGQELLLTAAQQLFAERGYERVTTRDIAELAGVDATLIARYFGSKAGLYLAALRAELGDGPPPDLLQPDRMAALLGRVDDRGPGPVFQSAVHPHEDESVQAAAREALHARLVTPLRNRFADHGVADPQLRAELATAAFAGVALGRASGAFPSLQKLPPEDLVALLQDLLAP